MNKLELMKVANEVRKGAVTAVCNAKSRTPGQFIVRCDITHICFLKR